MKRSGIRALTVLLHSKIAGPIVLTGLACRASADFECLVHAGSFDTLPIFSTLTSVSSGQSTTVSLSATPLASGSYSVRGASAS